MVLNKLCERLMKKKVETFLIAVLVAYFLQGIQRRVKIEKTTYLIKTGS